MKILELLNKKPPYFINIFLKSHNYLNNLLHRTERAKMTYFVLCYLKSYIPKLATMTHSKLDQLS